ncbi:uncharacterized protein TRIADDRAFT_19424, partial [Trichoplax adhaerens]
SAGYLIYTNPSEIRIVDTNGKGDRLLISGLHYAVAIDYHLKKKAVYWTDSKTGRISHFNYKDMSALKNNAHYTALEAKVVPNLQFDSLAGIAVDWINDKLYFIDDDNHRIYVSNLDGTNAKALFTEGIAYPRAIAVDPLQGYIYWTEWGDKNKIVRAAMDGSAKQIIRSDNMYWPNGLSIDYLTEKLFFTDGYTKAIYRLDLNGSNFVSIKSNLQHPHDITVHGKRLFWTDWEAFAIQSCHKTSGKEGRKIITGNKTPLGIKSLAPKHQPRAHNPCGHNNGNCSHLCLISPSQGNNSQSTGYTCACPTGVSFKSGKVCHSGPINFLLITRRSDLRWMSLDAPQFIDVRINIQDIKHAFDVTYDPVDHYIYWADNIIQAILRAKLDGSGASVIIPNIQSPEGLAIDWIARTIYWTDKIEKKIEVATLNGTQRKTIIKTDLDTPRAIAIDPFRGYIFWSDWGKVPKIERAYLDGSDRKVIVNDSIVWPNGIAIDYDKQILYWADADRDTIEISDLNGHGRKTLVKNNLFHVFGLTLQGDYIYYSDWIKRKVERIHKSNPTTPEVVYHRSDLMGLAAVDLAFYQRAGAGNNTCAHKNGGCSHYCFFRGSGHICSCPFGYELQEDEKTCFVPNAFFLLLTSKQLYRLSLNDRYDIKKLPINGIQGGSGLSFDSRTEEVYWSDIELKQISSSYLNGTNRNVIIEFDLASPNSIAFDWTTKYIYWTDNILNRIEVTKSDGTARKILIWQDLYKPSYLVIHPKEGLLFWVNHNSNVLDGAKIERSTLAGTERKTIVEVAGIPVSLEIDFDNDRIFWIDSTRKRIYSASLLGTNLEMIPEFMSSSNFLSIYEDKLYWIDSKESHIMKANKTNFQREHVHDLRNFDDHPNNLLVYHKNRQKHGSACDKPRNPCRELCLSISSKDAVCECSTHLVAKGGKCTEPNAYLLFAQQETISKADLDGKSNPHTLLPIQDMHHQIHSITYDEVQKYYYWIDKNDQGHSVINRAAKSTSELVEYQEVVNEKKQDIYDIALDSVNRYLFWSSENLHSIQVAKIGEWKSYYAVIGYQYAPRSIAIDPYKSHIYWIHAGSADSPKIYRCNYDATYSAILIENELYQPTSLTIDISNSSNRLYWIDLGTRTISSARSDGTNRHDLDFNVKSPINPYSVAIYSKYIYWADLQDSAIYRSYKLPKSPLYAVPQLVFNRLSDLTGINVVNNFNMKACSNHNCTHLCIVDSYQKSTFRCSCPFGYRILNDSRTCQEIKECGKGEFKCRSPSISTCINEKSRCDNIINCIDNSDEINCPKCSPFQFHCKNDKCIPWHKKCDGINDCDDNSDEFSCGRWTSITISLLITVAKMLALIFGYS